MAALPLGGAADSTENFPKIPPLHKRTHIIRWTNIIFATSKNAAFIAILVMMATTLADIVLRSLGQPLYQLTGLKGPVSVLGVVDIVEAMVIVSAFLSIPYVFIRDKHVGVEIITERLGDKARWLLKMLAALLSGSFMVMCLYTGSKQFIRQWSVGYLSATLGIPLWWFWLAILLGSALSVLACIVIIWRALRPNDQEG